MDSIEFGKIQQTQGVVQTGFYVVVSDRDLLGKMQELMKRQGYLGFMDTAGKLNYLIDGRQNMYKAAHTISYLNPKMSGSSDSKEKPTDRSSRRHIKRLVIALLEEFGFNKRHRGTAVLQYLLPYAYEHEERIAPLGKYLYPLAARHFNIKAQQVDRVVRYAAKVSQLKLGNANLIHFLVDEMTKRLHRSNEEKSELD